MVGSRKKNQKFFSGVVILSVLLAWAAFEDSGVRGQEWPDAKVRILPDDAFALVETDVGEKIRHCPHHDINGKLDAEQLIFQLGTLERETWLDVKNEIAARKHLEKHYDRWRKGIEKEGIRSPIDINTAKLTELVTLPHIGPVSAVKIVEYRDAHGLLVAVEDIKKIAGIGQGTFNAIQHYITVD